MHLDEGWSYSHVYHRDTLKNRLSRLRHSHNVVNKRIAYTAAVIDLDFSSGFRPASSCPDSVPCIHKG
jgi:hypothetical protein